MRVYTASDLIRNAMMSAQVLQKGEQPQQDDANDVLDLLNEMTDAWQLETLLIWAHLVTSFAYQANKQLYTWGPGGDINATRPLQIITAWTRDPNGFDIYQDILQEVEWDRIPVKNTPGTYPTQVFYDPQQPLGQLNVWPNPNVSTYTQFVRTDQVMQQFPTLQTQFTLPNGFALAIRYNLAILLADLFGASAVITDKMITTAQTAKRKIKNINLANKMKPLSTDFPRGTQGSVGLNILTNRPNSAP